jgi:hypothetical protein
MSCLLCPLSTSSICSWIVVTFECSLTCLVGNWMFAGSLPGSCEGEEGKMKNSPIKLFTCFVVSANVALRRAFCFAVSLIADDDGCNQGEGPAGSFVTLIEVCAGRLRLLEEIGGNDSVVQAHKGLYSNLKGRGVDKPGGFPGGQTPLGSNPRSQSLFLPKSSLLLVATTSGPSRHFFMKPRKASFCFGVILLPGTWLRARGQVSKQSPLMCHRGHILQSLLKLGRSLGHWDWKILSHNSPLAILNCLSCSAFFTTLPDS